ncbi:sensor histidine kinase [Nitzschia inconspicua]|uniref:Sensor histidine kinase n=1 Tax=Nitzschia inconspicua TaxID=303405 RepID=A0A9K3KYQ3_9STRA|nr:sensor histidine kinase [Nitzschia inconspicua]
MNVGGADSDACSRRHQEPNGGMVSSSNHSENLPVEWEASLSKTSRDDDGRTKSIPAASSTSSASSSASSASTSSHNHCHQPHHRNRPQQTPQQRQQDQETQQPTQQPPKRPPLSSPLQSSVRKSSSKEPMPASSRIIDYDSLQVMNFLVHPVWIFDFVQKRMRWANEVALEMWDATSLEELQHRNFHDISDAASKRMQDYHLQFDRGIHNFFEQYTLYPKGVAKTVHMNVSGVRFRTKTCNNKNNNNKDGNPTITVDDHFSIFCEGIPLVEQELLNENLRGLEMLRHLPIAVCQFDIDGKVMFQNPQASMVLVANEESNDTNNTEQIIDADNNHRQDESSSSYFDEDDEEQVLKEELGIPATSTTTIVEDEEEQVLKVELDNPGTSKTTIVGNKAQQNTNPLMVDQHHLPPPPPPPIDAATPEVFTYSSSVSSASPYPGDQSSTTSNSNSPSSTSPYKHQRLQGSLLSRFVDKTLGKKVLQEIQTNAQHNKNMKTDDVNKQIDLEAMIHTHEGPKWSAVQLRVCKDPVTGDPVILYSAMDNSDAIRAQKEKEARERKSEFLAIMAHEIRTPLHQVTGFIDLLHDTDLSKEQQSYVNLLRSSAKGLMTVISDVLDYSKLEAGKMKLECIPYEPFSVVEGSLAVVRGSCEEKGLELKLEWNKDIPFRILGDPNRLRQILLNLLSNSVKFTTRGGIYVTAMKVLDDKKSEEPRSPGHKSTSALLPQPMVKFVVRDTGIGIEEEHRNMIFNDYYQGDVSIARTHGGTGLGLSICKLLVSRMGGTIGVDSEYGKGSAFWFCLPADVPIERISPDVTPSPNAPDNGKKVKTLNVLIAEDNVVNQKLLKRMLERMGHNAVVAENGMEAIQQIEAHKGEAGGYFDVVLMDIQMPVIDGLEATRRLRSMGYANLPIYGLTASVGRSDYAELGFDDWLPKPIPLKRLREKLANIRLSHDSHNNSDS